MKVVDINSSKVTPEMVASETLAIADELDCLVVIKILKNGMIDFSFSDASPGMLANLALAFQSELMSQMQE